MRALWVLLLSVLVCGCVCIPSDESSSKGSTTLTSVTVAESALESAAVQTSGEGQVKSIHDRLVSPERYFCNFTDGRRRCEIWLHDGRYFAVITEGQRPDSLIANDGVWEYIWLRGQKAGVKYKNSEVMGLSGESTTVEVESNRTKFVLFDIAEIARHSKSIECWQSEFADDIFYPPKLMQFRVTKARLIDAQT